MIEDYYRLYREPLSSEQKKRDSSQVLGTFDPMNFIIRIDERLSQSKFLHSTGVIEKNSEKDYADVLAFATYLHELFHWWQHIGTTTGFLCASTIVSQARNLIHFYGTFNRKSQLRKPLFLQVLSGYGKITNSEQSHLNSIVNTWFDIELAQALLRNPALYLSMFDNDFFESIGHSFYITLSSLVSLLRNTFKSESDLFPDKKAWDREYNSSIHNKIKNFKWDDIESFPVPEIGLKDIFEGQARFQELQYLAIALGLNWSDFAKHGYLNDAYIKAFKEFLYITNLPWPNSPLSSTVNLFLLICDLASNSGIGYPDDINTFTNFCEDLQPGTRFVKAANFVKQNPKLLQSLENVRKEDYCEANQKISQGCGWKSTIEILKRIETIANSLKEHPLLHQEIDFKLPIRANFEIGIIYSRHLNFIKAKIKFPYLFCWPGYYLAGDLAYFNVPDFFCWPAGDITHFNASELHPLFINHAPILMAKGWNKRVLYFPPAYITETEEHRLLALAYIKHIILFDIHRQIIARYGDVSFNFRWLDPENHDEKYHESLVQDNIERLFGRNLDDFEPY